MVTHNEDGFIGEVVEFASEQEKCARLTYYEVL